MPSGRQPQTKGAKAKPEILRAVRLGDNGDVYGPGEEEELLNALEDEVARHNKVVKANKVGEELDVNEELERLSILGHLINFKGVDLDEEDLEEQDQDLYANKRARERALVEAPGNEGTPSTRRRGVKRRTRNTEGVESNPDEQRLDDGQGETLDPDAVDEAGEEKATGKRGRRG